MIEGFEVLSDDTRIGIMDLLQQEVTEKLISDLKSGELTTDDEIVLSFVPCCIRLTEQVDFLRTVGLIHFKDDEQAQLIINDFCGLLKDMLVKGDEILHKE